MNRKSSDNPAIGKRVVTLAGCSNRLPKDFPGWGHPEAIDSLLATEAGLHGVIRDVEHHGSNPWTRYSVLFEDGSYSDGLIIGKDIKLA